jgi:hypothetical protein
MKLKVIMRSSIFVVLKNYAVDRLLEILFINYSMWDQSIKNPVLIFPPRRSCQTKQTNNKYEIRVYVLARISHTQFPVNTIWTFFYHWYNYFWNIYWNGVDDND